MTEDRTERQVLPRIPRSLALLFGAELLLLLYTGASAVSLAVRGRPNGPFMAVPAILFFCAISSFPVVVGRGIGAGLRRAAAVVVALLAVGISLFALVEASRLADDMAERELAVDREVKEVEFDVEYPKGGKGGPEHRAAESRLELLESEKKGLDADRSGLLRSTAIIIGACTVLLVLNILMAVECSRLIIALKEQRRSAGGRRPG